MTDDVVAGPEEARPEPDDRLRLIFTCCHPALSRDAQVALTLRLLCGLSTVEVARAFLVPESTMAARITRAKRKIANARIPYRVPSQADLPQRLAAVLEVLHLVFTTGHTAPVGAHLVRAGSGRTARSISLGTLPHAPAARARGRRAARADAAHRCPAGRPCVRARGSLVLLADQDRTRWDRAKIEKGVALLTESLARRPPTRFGLQAAIAAVHAEAPTWSDTDWDEIVALYEVLARLWPSPVVELNRAVAIGKRTVRRRGCWRSRRARRASPRRRTAISVPRAHFLRRLDRWAEAATSYEEALAMTDNEIERAFLAGRLDEARSRPSSQRDADPWPGRRGLRRRLAGRVHVDRSCTAPWGSAASPHRNLASQPISSTR